MSADFAMPVGLYEKALPVEWSWETRLRAASQAGYDFVEMSVDESEVRLARLDWTASDRAALRQAITNTGVPILTMCLSGHRKYPLGSHDPETRDCALRILHRAIELADAIGIRIVQLMGYDVFYEPSDDQTRAYFIDGVRCGTRWAGQYGVMLALENVDRPLAASVERALELVHAVNSPWFQLYSDMANLQAAGFHPPEQLALAAGHLVAVHVKDGLPGIIRGVPFEKGDVPFEATFQALAHIGFWGPMTVEMWAQMDAGGDPLASVVAARSLVRRLTDMAWRGDNLAPDPKHIQADHTL